MSEATATEATTARGLYDQGVRLAALKKHADAAESFSRCLELLRAQAQAEKNSSSSSSNNSHGAADAGSEDAKRAPSDKGSAQPAVVDEGEDDPKLAPVMHKYGRELLNYAITSSSALGGGGGGGGGGGAGSKNAPLPSTVPLPAANKKTSRAAGASGSSSGPTGGAAGKKVISFSGDTEEYNADEEEEDHSDGDAEAGDGEEDETDMDVAFYALDVARHLYERLLAVPDATLETIEGNTLTSTDLTRQYANVLTDLGELHLEGEEFREATKAFQAALDALEPVTDPLSFSRRLAEAHLMLCLALEFHPEPKVKARALEHAQTTQRLLQERRAALIERRDSDAPPLSRENPADAAPSTNGKGKGKAAAGAGRLAEDDVRLSTKEKAIIEIGDVDELLKDMDSKIEELQANAKNGSTSNGQGDDAVRKAIDQAFLGGALDSNPFSSGAAVSAGPANDLTTLVKKKKRPAAAPVLAAALATATETASKASDASAGEKRKADTLEDTDSKKARVEDAQDAE